MAPTAQFAYLQVRLQSRHGARPDAALWRRLEGIVDFANYLQSAQQSALRIWLMTVHAGQDSNEIEQALRRQLRQRMDEVAGWMPSTWRPAVRWVRRLPDLPALRHLLAGEPAPLWMHDDPELRGFTSEHATLRLDAMRQSDCRVLVQAWLDGTPLWDAWLRHWQGLWPDNRGERRGMDVLCRLLRHEMLGLQEAGQDDRAQRLDDLEQRLAGAFRCFSFLPAAAFLHLALVSLDLARLRGGLLVRKLFQVSPEQVA